VRDPPAAADRPLIRDARARDRSGGEARERLAAPAEPRARRERLAARRATLERPGIEAFPRARAPRRGAIASFVAVDDAVAAEPGALRRVERAERRAREPGLVVEPGGLARRAVEIGAVAHLGAGDHAVAAQLRLAIAGATRALCAGEHARAAFSDAA